MENNEIQLPYNLAIAVWDSLAKKGIPKRTNKLGLMTNVFTQEEINQVTHLSLVNFSSSLDGISLLTNLKNLSITSTGSSAYKSSKDLISITDKDLFEIEKLTNLKHLSIDNQRLITSIDVSNFKNLQSLQLTKNEELVDITGLENNKTIGSLTLYDLNNLKPIKNFDKFIANNPELFETNLDVLLFPQAIGYKHMTNTINQAAYDRIMNDIDAFSTWCETCSNKVITINNYQMKQLHKKAHSIVSKYCNGTIDIETIATVDRWLAENVKYNYGALGTTLRGEVKDGILQGPVKGVNGAYNAFIYGSCVCEGYTRAMQYMLGLKGIHTANTHCIACEDTMHMSEASYDNEFTVFNLPKTGYHSICRIERDSGIYYCDPCWDAGRFQRGDKSLPYLLLTKSQISKDHTLSFNDKNISHKDPIPENYLNQIKTNANNIIQGISKQG